MSTMTFLTPKLNYTIIVVAALYCLTPLTYLPEQKKYIFDEIASYEHMTAVLIERSASLLASFFIVIIPAADLLLDMPSHISSYFYPRPKSASNATESSRVLRLYDFERFLFIIGVGIESLVWFLSSRTDPASLGILYFSTSNASLILVIGPILTYLQRCTTTFTSLRVFSLVASLSAGLVILTTCGYYRRDQRIFITVVRTGTIILVTTGVALAALIAMCAFEYSRLKFIAMWSERAEISFPKNQRGSQAQETKTVESKDQRVDNDNELYTNYIPALHMTTCLIIIFSNIYVHVVKSKYPVGAFEAKNFIVGVAEVIVLVTELRIRKNEIARGLVGALSLFNSYTPHPLHFV